jgi:hypothetical protein
LPAEDIPAISLDVAELADCESAVAEPLVLPVTVLGADDTVGAATGLGTIGGATGVANEQIYTKSKNKDLLKFVLKMHKCYYIKMHLQIETESFAYQLNISKLKIKRKTYELLW